MTRRQAERAISTLAIAAMLSGTPAATGQDSSKPATDPQPREVGRYTPNAGFTLADTDQGQLVVRLFAVARYLNQRGLDDSYVDAFGQTKTVKLRQDIQLNKVIVYFLGWVFSEKFRYFTYVWTTNTSQGQGAQVVVAG